MTARLEPVSLRWSISPSTSCRPMIQMRRKKEGRERGERGYPRE
jgi:hypothetical protein